MACGDPGITKCAGTRAASAVVAALAESLLEPLVAGDQKASLASLSPQPHPFRRLQGSPAWGPSLSFRVSGTWRGPPGWGAILKIGTSVT